MIDELPPPVWKHDCSKCIFLGTVVSQDQDPGKEVDLYVCTETLTLSANWTVTCRFGEDGEYISGACFAPHCPDLYEAAQRAIQRGVIHQDDYDKVVKQYGSTITPHKEEN